MENPPIENSSGGQGKGFWATLGKISLIVAIVAAVVAASITLHDFVNRKSAKVTARVSASGGYDIPMTQWKALSEKLIKNYEEEFFKSFPDDEQKRLREKEPKLLENLKEVIKKQRDEQWNAFKGVIDITQSVRVHVHNSGNQHAEGVFIELPIGVEGFYQVDSLETLPFKKNLEIGTVRAESLTSIDIYLRGKVIKASEVDVSYQGGKVTTETPFQGHKQSILDLALYPLLTIQTSLILLVAAAWYAVTRNKKKIFVLDLEHQKILEEAKQAIAKPKSPRGRPKSPPSSAEST